MADRVLLYSPMAQQDLEGVFDYISNSLRNPAAARNVISDILDGAEKLESFPFIGSLVEGLPERIGEYRVLGIRNYLIFYRVSDTSIFVDRVLYKRRDYLPLLGLQETTRPPAKP